MGTTLSVLIFYLFFGWGIRYHGNMFTTLPDVTDPHPEIWVCEYEQNQAMALKKKRAGGQQQNGVFYTPMPIAQALIRQTLGEVLAKHADRIRQACQDNDLETAYQILKDAQALTLIDPACGTGVFLVAALQAFKQFYDTIPSFCEQIQTGLQHALEHQLFGIDLDPESVQVTQKRLNQWFSLLQNTTPDNAINLLCEDTLALDFKDRQWDFIVGNPPYVSEVRKQAGRFKALQKTAQQKGSVYYQAKMDLCDAFLAWGLRHIRANGQLAYVLPEYWTQRSSTRTLRKQLIEQGQLRAFWRFNKTGIFKAAPGHHTSLLVWQACSSSKTNTILLGQISCVEQLETVQPKPGQYWLDAASGKLLFGEPMEINILARLSQSQPLLQAKQIQQGIVLPQGRLDIDRQNKAGLPHPGVFLLTDDEVEHMRFNPAERALLKPFFMPARFQMFAGFPSQTPDFWLIYTDAQVRKRLISQPEDFPNLIAHLERCTPVNTSSAAPYGLHRPRQSAWFESPDKILSPRQVMQPAFAQVTPSAFVGEGFYVIQPRPKEAGSLLAILNSSLAWFWLYHQKRKGERLQIDKDVLCAFPQPSVTSPSFTSKLDHLVSVLQSAPDREQNQEVYRQIDGLVYQCYGLSPSEADFIRQIRHASSAYADL